MGIGRTKLISLSVCLPEQRGLIISPGRSPLPTNMQKEEKGDNKDSQVSVTNRRKRQVYDTIFKMIDDDGGGSLEESELKGALEKLGEPLTDEEIKDMIKEIDLDGDGAVNPEEFYLMIQTRIQDKTFTDALRRSFDLFTEENKEWLTQKEFMKIVAAAKKETNQFAVDEIMRKLPWDNKGNIVVERFITELLRDL